MSTAREELYELAEEDYAQSSQQTEKPSVKQEVQEAIHDYAQQQQQAQEESAANERQRKNQEQQQAEDEELQASSQAVIATLKEEMEKDEDFKKIIKKNDLPSTLVEQIAEVADPEEASLIVRELANNEEFQDSLKRSKTSIGQKRIISKIRKAVLTGGGPQRPIPKMLEKSIPQYNPNNAHSSYNDDDYSDIAMRHGL